MGLHSAVSWTDFSPSKMAVDLFSLSLSLPLLLSVPFYLHFCLYLCFCVCLCCSLCLSLVFSLSLAGPLFTEWWLSSKKKEAETDHPLRTWVGSPRISLCHIPWVKASHRAAQVQGEGTPIPRPPRSSHKDELRQKSWAARDAAHSCERHWRTPCAVGANETHLFMCLSVRPPPFAGLIFSWTGIAFLLFLIVLHAQSSAHE